LDATRSRLRSKEEPLEHQKLRIGAGTFTDAGQQDAMAVRGSSFRHRRGGDTVMTAETFHFQQRFGMVAIRKEFITLHQLVEAMTIQVREDVEGKPHRRIGEILTDLGHMTPSQIQVVLWEIADGRE
jgi:hypothetical protein